MLGSQDRAVVWRERLRRHQQSRLTVAEFCRREGVSVPSFYQWRRRLCQISTGPQAKPVADTQRRQTPAAFQPVLLTGGEVVSIELPSGVRVELPAGQSALVQSVIAELLRSETSRTENV